MKRPLALAAAGIVALSTVAAAPASESSQAPDHTLELMIGESGEVSGGPPAGVHPGYFDLVPLGTAGQCTHDPQSYCESVLIRVENPYEEENARKGRERANLFVEITPTHPGADFDLLLYESDEDGTQGTEIGRSAGTPIADSQTSSEAATAVVTTTEEETVQWVLAHVVYFAAPSDYHLVADFS